MGMPQTTRDSKLTILSQTFDNKRDFRKSVPSSIVTITGGLERKAFKLKDFGSVKTGKASFDIATNYQGNSWVIVKSEAYNVGLSLDDNVYSSYYQTIDNGGPFQFGSRYIGKGYGTPIYVLPNFVDLKFNLSDYRNAGHLKFFLWECYAHLNTWTNCFVYINFGNHYYYKYIVVKTSSITEWRFVEKGKYYEGLY